MKSERHSSVTVKLGLRSYPIITGTRVLADAPQIIASATTARNFLLVSHPRLLELYGGTLASNLVSAGYTVRTTTVPAGEKSKTLRMASRLFAELASAGIDRHGCILALGGGVVGDLAGFAAAAWLRGIDVVQIPTTLLAMVDSAIGGKTGVNLPIGKNLVGAFHQPRAVIVDTDVLTTLPSRDIRSGMAEVIKYGVISEPALFSFIEENAAACREAYPAALKRCIRDSVACKARVVSEDEREGSLRAILNFGHTAGHAVEKAAGYRRLRHGEAVSIGMVAAVRIGVVLGITPSSVATRLENVLIRTGLPTVIPAGLSVAGLMETLALDKKAKGGSVKWVMANRIGEVKTGVDVPAEIAREVMLNMGAQE